MDFHRRLLRPSHDTKHSRQKLKLIFDDIPSQHDVPWQRVLLCLGTNGGYLTTAAVSFITLNVFVNCDHQQHRLLANNNTGHSCSTAGSPSHTLIQDINFYVDLWPLLRRNVIISI